ncbi:MAG: S26 family signal peptidase, partial [Merdibacter sp.]|nr:S26 family signal peptidase [Merdibacter sp.]
EYFVMGDNRVVSADSRVVGAFTRDQIVGKGVFVLFPFDQIGYHNQ